jgi:arylsulfatase A-like enzyme/Tfp pilus assembly protein PilF
MLHKKYLGLYFIMGAVMLCPDISAQQMTSADRWNVLLITIDTLRADKLSCYGSERVQTPNIDGLAHIGILFNRAFAQSPLTLPSHANMLLGTTPPYHGVHDNMNFIIREDFLTLAEHLKLNGYRTGAVIGAFPLDSRFGLAQGFDFYEDDFKKKGISKYAAGERNSESVVRLAQNWLDRQSAPWFLWMHVWDPHFPYEPPEPFLSQYKNKPYNGEVAYVDHVLGTFFQYMTETGLIERTLIVFTSDHGESLGDHGEKTHGMFAYNSTIWVPMIIAIPGFKPGKRDHQVSHIDIFPTVCDVLGIEKPDTLQGISLVPAMRGKKFPARKIYFESLEPYYNFGWAPLRGYIHQKDKFIDSPIFEYYNIDLDFNEKRNLAADIIVGKFRSELKKIIAGLSHPDSKEARTDYNYKTLEKLRSLGYVSYSTPTPREKFSKEHDIKTLLPQLNQCFNAYGYLDSGNVSKGIDILQKMIRKNTKIYQPYVYLAKLFNAAGRPEEALPILEEGMQRFPTNYEIVRSYGQYLLESEQYERAVQVIVEKKFLGMEQDPVIWDILGRAYCETGAFEASIKAFETAISIDKEFADAPCHLGSTYLAMSAETEDENFYFKAIEYIKRAIALDPEHDEAHFQLGLAYFQTGEFTEAISYFEKSQRLGWDSEKTYFYLGVAHLSQGNRERARHYLTAHKDSFMPLLSSEEKRNLESYLRRLNEKKSPEAAACLLQNSR